jgi:hypothetical protein
MNRWVALAALALIAFLASRRKTLKEDGTRVTATVKDGASKLTERVRGDSGGDSDDNVVVDLDESDNESAIGHSS